MKNNLQKIAFIVALALFVVPQVTFAAWWNPFTWFSDIDRINVDYNQKMTEEKRSNNVLDTTSAPPVSESTPQIKTTFYVKYDSTRLRKCASTDCDVLGYYKVNDQIISTDSKTLSLNDMPEWIMFTLPEGKTAYINKSVLSETRIPAQEVMSQKTVDSNRLSDADKKIITGWVDHIDREIVAQSDLIEQIRQDGYQNSAADVIDVIQVYVLNLKVLKNELTSALVRNNRGDVSAAIGRIQNLSDKYNIDFKLSLDNSVRNLRISTENARAQAVDDAYRQVRAQQDAINQARLDSANAYTDKYNEIMENAKREGLTQGVVNNQLNAAGLIRQVNCSYSSVGGMTPGGGSVTCY